MRAGTLRHRIIIQSGTEARDAYGAVTVTWGTFATVWARVEPLSGKETYVAQTIKAETAHKITIRYLSGVLAKMRVLFGTRTFDIKQIINWEERNKELALIATEFIS